MLIINRLDRNVIKQELFVKSKFRYAIIFLLGVVVFTVLTNFMSSQLLRFNLFDIGVFLECVLASYLFESFCYLIYKLLYADEHLFSFKDYLSIGSAILVGTFAISVVMTIITQLVSFNLNQFTRNIFTHFIYFFVPGFTISLFLTYQTINVRSENYANKLLEETKKSNRKSNYFYFRSGRNIYFKKFNEIVYLMALRNNAVLRTNEEDGEYVMMASLKSALDDLPEEQFVQVHKSYVVNKNYIDFFERQSGNYRVMMNDERRSVVPVGRKYTGLVKNISNEASIA